MNNVVKNFKTTREMKDSKIEWIGEIPKEWKLPLLGAHFKERSEKVSDKEYKPLSVTKQGIVPQLENVAKTDNNDNRKKICINDFVINSRSDRKGSSGLSKYEGSTSNISIVLELRDIFPMYAHYLLRSYVFVEEFYRWGNGIVEDLWSTRYSSMKKINIPFPPFHEQQAIANYLDEKVGKIDNLIAEQKTAIENWKEYKESLITETVTKGLHSDDSKTWKMYKLGDLGKYKKGPFGSSLKISMFVEKGDKTFKVYEQKNAIKKDATIGEAYITLEDFENLKSFEVKEKDIIVSCAGTIGECYVLPEKIEKGIINQALMKVTVDDSLEKDYFVKLLQVSLKELSKEFSNGSAIKNIPPFSVLKKHKVLVPSINRQKEILLFLDEKCSKIDQTIEQKQVLIKQLEEYKQSLIYECVTGKRCVKER